MQPFEPVLRAALYAARRNGREAALQTALQAALIAAVGPVVAGEVQRRGFTVAIAPEHAYFMKPLVTAIVAALAK